MRPLKTYERSFSWPWKTPRVSRGWIKQPLVAVEVAFHPSIRPSGKFHLRFCVCPTDFAEPVAEEQLRGQAPDAEPWL